MTARYGYLRETCVRGHSITDEGSVYFNRDNTISCKECAKLDARERRAKNPEKFREIRRRYEQRKKADAESQR